MRERYQWASRGRSWLPLGLALAASAAWTPQGHVTTPSAQQARPDATAFAVYALSRGKGVPPAAREALKKVGEIVEADRRRGVRVETTRTRIGLEGETRLCIDYEKEADARRALEKIEKVVKDVDLVNVVSGACPASEKGPAKGEKP